MQRQPSADRVQKKRVEFWQKIRDIPVENLIFLDESGVNLAMLRIYARALKGHRARGTKPQKRGKNVSLLTALSLDKIIASINIYGAVNGVAFEAFIANKLVPNLWTGACVVMDNAKIHLGKEIRVLIESVGAKLIYLSPYSPEFNRGRKFLVKSQSLPKKIESKNI